MKSMLIGMRRTLKRLRSLLAVVILLYVLPYHACAGVYDSCVLSYDFGNRAVYTVAIHPVGQSCTQKCQNACGQFIISTLANAAMPAINEQASMCFNLCQRGQPFTGFVYRPYFNSHNSVNTRRAIIETITVTADRMCTDADLSLEDGFDTGLVREMGAMVTYTIGGSTSTSTSSSNSTYPNPKNQFYTCGYREVALEPAMFSPTYADWTVTDNWFTQDQSPPAYSWAANLTTSAEWYFDNQNNPATGNATAILGMTPCLAILNPAGVTNITNQKLWGGYETSNNATAHGNTMWGPVKAMVTPDDVSNYPFVQSPFYAPNAADVYNYHNTCNWNARNLYPTYTGINLSDGDLLAIFWTNNNSTGYRSLGANPVDSSNNSKPTFACYDNLNLYEAYVDEINAIYNGMSSPPAGPTALPAPQSSASTGCNLTTGSDNSSNGSPLNTSYTYASDPNAINGTDIYNMCTYFQGYTFNYNGPCSAPDASDCLPGQIPQSQPTIVKGDSFISLFTHSLSQSATVTFNGTPGPAGTPPVNSLKFLISEAGPAVPYIPSTFSYKQTTSSAQSMIIGASPTPNPSSPLFCSSESATCAHNILNFTNLLGGKSSSGYDPSLFFYAFDANGNNLRADNFYCYNYLGGQNYNSWNPLYYDTILRTQFYQCIGLAQPMIWDAYRTKMFFNTAFPASGTNGTILDDFYNINSSTFNLFHFNTWGGTNGGDINGKYVTNGNGYGLTHDLICNTMNAPNPINIYNQQAAIIKNGNYEDQILKVVRQPGISIPVVVYGGPNLGAGNTPTLLIIPSDTYDKYFTNLTHFYDYLQAIRLILPTATTDPSAASSGATPNPNIVNAMNGVPITVPGVIDYKKTCNTSFDLHNNTTTYNDAIFEWLIRSSLEGYFGNPTNNTTRFTPRSSNQTSLCTFNTPYTLTGNIYDAGDRVKYVTTNSKCANATSQDAICSEVSNITSDWSAATSFLGTMTASSSSPVPGQNTQPTPPPEAKIYNTPVNDYLYSLIGTVDKLSSVGSPGPLYLRHPSRVIPGLTDQQILWSQVGGTNAYVIWAGCPVSLGSNNNLTFQYKIVREDTTSRNAGGSPCNGTVLTDWTNVSGNQINFTVASGNATPDANQTTYGRLCVRSLLAGDIGTGANYSTSCQGDPLGKNSCAYNRFGSINFSVTSISSLLYSTTLGSDPFSNGIGEIVNIIYQTLYGNAQKNQPGVVSQLYQAIVMDGKVIQIGRAFVTLYIAIFAIKFILGMMRNPQQDIIMALVKAALVLAATSPTSFDFFYNQLFSNLSRAAVSLAYQFANGVLLNFSDIDSFNQQDFTDNPGAIFAFFSGGWYMLFSTAIWFKIAALIFSSLMGLIMAIVVLAGAVLYAIAIVEFAMLLVSSFIILGILILVAPLFICFMLFENTKQLFDTWARYVIGTTLIPGIAFLGVLLLNFVMVASIVSTLNFTACLMKYNILGLFSISIPKPIMYLQVPITNAITPFYQPFGLIANGIMILTVGYCMYVLINWIPTVITRMINSQLNAALLTQGGQGAPMAVKAASWAGGFDGSTQNKLRQSSALEVKDQHSKTMREISGKPDDASAQSRKDATDQNTKAQGRFKDSKDAYDTAASSSSGASDSGATSASAAGGSPTTSGEAPAAGGGAPAAGGGTPTAGGSGAADGTP